MVYWVLNILLYTQVAHDDLIVPPVWIALSRRHVVWFMLHVGIKRVLTSAILDIVHESMHANRGLLI